MRGDGVPVATGMLDREAVAPGVMKAEGAIVGLFQAFRAYKTLRAWYTWRINGVTMGTMRSWGWMPRRCQRRRYVAVS